MSKGAGISIFGTLVLIIIVSSEVKGQNRDPNSIRLMFYNAENFFDTVNDTLRADDDFLPGGVMRWNHTRYEAKLSSIYKVITAAGDWNPPEIIGFCEIENRKVLEDLTGLTYLSKYNYGIVHEESPDERGIDVCLIYLKGAVKLLYYTYLIPSGYTFGNFSSRSVLYTKWLMHGDTVHLFLNHWPSRRGGVLAGEPLREKISLMVKAMSDSILNSSEGTAKILIAGDFNCTPADNEVDLLVKTGEFQGKLINLTAPLSEQGEGTYRYQGSWEMIDQVIVSENLISSNTGLFSGQAMVKIFKPPFLLVKDPVWPGFKPYSTYSGFKYQGGFSDHLPVLLDLGLRK